MLEGVTEQGDPRRQPNFVIFLADDLGYGDLGCYGNKSFGTKRVDRMAAEGARLTDFYAMPTCTPARASLLTGRYPIRSGLIRVLVPREHFGVPKNEVTLGDVLKPAGYRTACIGKWHLGDLPPYRPNSHGFDFYYGLLYSNDMTLAFGMPRMRLYRNGEAIEWPVKQAILTKRYTAEAVRFIRENREQPFLLYLSYAMPHVPLSSSEEFRGKSSYGPYGDAVEEIDWSVGEVLDEIKRYGLDDRTLAVFTSDNGPALGTPVGGSAGGLRGGKSTTWEGGVRVPCVVRWPGQVPPGAVRAGVSCLMDIFATCVSLAGARPPDDRPTDGQNLMPLLQEQSSLIHPEFYYYFGAHLCAVRSGRWKLHMSKREYDRRNKLSPLSRCDPPELYDLQQDAGESRNVSAQNRVVVETLQGLGREFQDAVQAGRLPKSILRSVTPVLRHRKD
jgi:arylsulfatase A